MTIIADYDIRLPKPKRFARQIPDGPRAVRVKSGDGFRYWMEFTQVLYLHVDELYEERSLHVEETDRMHCYCPPCRGGYVRRWNGKRQSLLVAVSGRKWRRR